MRTARTKATGIYDFTKKVVWERDNHCCIFCGRPVVMFYACSHVIPRSGGGLGIEENVVTACWDCHSKMDQTTSRKAYLKIANDYLRSKYPNFDEVQKIYTKGWERK